MIETPQDTLREAYTLLLTAARDDLEGAHHLVATYDDPRPLLAALVSITEQVGMFACNKNHAMWVGYLTDSVARLDAQE